MIWLNQVVFLIHLGTDSGLRRWQPLYPSLPHPLQIYYGLCNQLDALGTGIKSQFP